MVERTFQSGRKAGAINKDKKLLELNMKTGNRFLAVMKRGLASIVAIFVTMGVSGNCLAQTQGEKKSRLLTFERTVHDFGKIAEEDGPQTCIFKYRNNSNVAIVIQKVIVSCACTQVEWPEKPIKPGERGRGFWCCL